MRATREIGLPSLTVKIQPGETTLVNVPTIFHAEPRPFERSVTLLGFDVDLVATPITFHWVHGDGTSQDTSTPGKPYPALDVTHSYPASRRRRDGTGRRDVPRPISRERPGMADTQRDDHRIGSRRRARRRRSGPRPDQTLSATMAVCPLQNTSLT
ncbi:hypothetical protein [Aeromicrobium sp. UC242_57]|uniref:hypothetical protein n=1 Tax=Aeromicrobium sp. UC242_57 TaxID=3374624 RepID=UPI0037B0D2A8